MEILESKPKETIELVLNLQGEIMYVKSDLGKPFNNLKVGKNISNLIDMNYIQKISMYPNKMDVISVNNAVYKQAMISVFSRGYGRYIKLRFLCDQNDRTETDWILDKKLIGIIGEVVENKEASLVDLPQFLEQIKDEVKKEYYFLNVYCPELKYYTYKSVLQALILNGVGIMYELCPKKAVDLYVKELTNGLHIKMMMKIDNYGNAMNWQQVERKFPWMSLRVSAMDEACKQTNIYSSARIINNIFIIELVAGQINMQDAVLRTNPMASLNWRRISESLKPRAYILAMHDKRAKEKEE